MNKKLLAHITDIILQQKSGIYLGNCVEIGDGVSPINDYIDNATIGQQIVNNSKSITMEDFIQIFHPSRNHQKRNFQYSINEFIGIVYDPNDDVHYFYKK